MVADNEQPRIKVREIADWPLRMYVSQHEGTNRVGH